MDLPYHFDPLHWPWAGHYLLAIPKLRVPVFTSRLLKKTTANGWL